MNTYEWLDTEPRYRVRDWFRRLWTGIPAYVDRRLAAACDLGTVDGPGGESEWRYDNREQAHMRSGCWCGSPNGAKDD